MKIVAKSSVLCLALLLAASSASAALVVEWESAFGGAGDKDLMLLFNIPELKLAAGDTAATLIGTTRDGAQISGTDTVKVTKTAKKEQTPVPP